MAEQEFADVFDVFKRLEDVADERQLGQRRELLDGLNGADEFLGE